MAPEWTWAFHKWTVKHSKGLLTTLVSSFENQRHSPWKILINSVKTYKVSLEGLGKETAAAALRDPDHMKNVTCCFRAPHAPISSTWTSFLKPPQSTMKPRSSSLKTRKAIRPSSVHPSHALLWPDLSSGSHLGQTGRTHSQPNCNWDQVQTLPWPDGVDHKNLLTFCLHFVMRHILQKIWSE